MQITKKSAKNVLLLTQEKQLTPRSSAQSTFQDPTQYNRIQYPKRYSKLLETKSKIARVLQHLDPLSHRIILVYRKHIRIILLRTLFSGTNNEYGY